MRKKAAISRKSSSSSALRRLAVLLIALVLLALVLAGRSSQNSSSASSNDNASTTLKVSDNMAITPADYASKIEIIYQNDLGLYSGCELVSLAMTLNSMGIDIDSYEIANDYVEYANDNYSYESYGNNGFGFFSGNDEEYPSLDNRREAIDSTERKRPRENESDNEERPDSNSRRNAEYSEYGSSQEPSTEPNPSYSSKKNQDQGGNSKGKLTDYYIGDPYYSGMAYPPAIAKTANKILEANGSSLKATDRTGLGFNALLNYVEAGYPVIAWVTLDYTEPLVSWAPIGQDDWLWYDNLHCVVLCGHDSTTSTVTVADPLQGMIEMPVEEFETVFEQCGNMAVTIS